MSVLLTGAAGFIGFHTATRLLDRGEQVIGVDDLNDYYDVSLKESRLNLLKQHRNFIFHKVDIADRDGMAAVIRQHGEIDRIVHLAAQAGVRYSLSHPFAYSRANLEGHLVMLEVARHLKGCKHFVYASSSSVYGANKKLPFSVEDQVDNPISLYAATKKANELMSHSYSHLYNIPSTGLRFFTVYGPWGRPDMAAFLFARAIMAGEPIKVFNNGDMRRDFTFVDDIVAGVVGVLDKPPAAVNGDAPYRVYNIGNNRSESLLRFIEILENELGRKANKELLPMQMGDVKETFADIDAIQRDVGYAPTTSIDVGLPRFVQWFKEYYKIS